MSYIPRFLGHISYTILDYATHEMSLGDIESLERTLLLYPCPVKTFRA